MKKLSLLLFAALSIICFSCNDKNDDDDDSGIYGVWNVTENYTYNCNGQNFEHSYEYQISINQSQSDSVIITNLFEENWTFDGVLVGNSLSISFGSSGECPTTGIVSNNSISFNSGCTHKNFDAQVMVTNGCDYSSYYDEDYNVSFTATKQ